MDRYELVEGGSAKFWEAGVEGSTLTVRFGRLGTAGQTKEKVLASAAAAAAELAKLVKEKTGKGYAAAGSAAPMAAAAPVAARAAVAPPAAPPPKPVAAAVQAAAPAIPEMAPSDPPPAAALVPKAQGTGKLLSAPPLPSRTRPATAVPPDEAWATLQWLVASDFIGKDEAQRQSTAWLLAQLAGPPPATVTVDEAEACYTHIVTAHVAEPGVDYWKAAKPARDRWLAKAAAWASWLVGSQGALLGVQAASRLRSPRSHQGTYDISTWNSPLAIAMRAALSAVPDAAYDEAVAWCEAACRAEPDWKLAAYVTFILADDRPQPRTLQPMQVITEAERQGVHVGEQMLLQFLVELPPSATAGWRGKLSHHYYFFSAFFGADIGIACAAATLLTVTRAHGERAAPFLAWLFPGSKDEDRTVLAAAMLETCEDEALPLLLPFAHDKAIQTALNQAEAAYPDWMFRQSLQAAASGRADPALRVRVLRALEAHGTATLQSWAEGLPGKAVNFLNALIAGRDVALAPPEAWPEVLRAPPWRAKGRAAAPDVVLMVQPIPTPFAASVPARQGQSRYNSVVVADMAALAATVRGLEQVPKSGWPSDLPLTEPLVAEGAAPEDALAWLARRLAALHGAGSYRLYHCELARLYYALEQQPAPLALMLWELTGPLLNVGVSLPDALPAMTARFGEAALTGLVKLVEADPLQVLPLVADVDAPAIAPLAARALLRLKKVRAPAAAWLRRHRRTALLRLVPDAVGLPGEARDAAEYALRWLVADKPDGPAAVAEAVAGYARAEPDVTGAMAQVLGRDPLARVPAKVAKLPAWVSPAALSRPQLRAGGALPDEAVAALLEMLSFSTPENLYAGVPLVREACTPSSMGAFAWDLLSAWLAAGAPAKDGWAMRALGWLGDDECARRLTPLIRRWPGEAAHARAVTGLDVLADIGTDVALMNLNGIAEKVKFKGLQDRARDRIAVLAEARDLSPEELADRLAPDLDLDGRGGLDLPFGPRRFRVGFDEFLKPAVRDEAGARLKDLPKPGKADDAKLAADSAARWAAIKKDARAVATQQLVRLEAMLASARRVRPAVFQPFFAAHPLIRHLAQRLVWGLYPDAGPMTAPSMTFRVTEDLSLTDASDDPAGLDVSDGAAGLVGLVHPLQAPAALDAWGTLFGDYEIAQPFPQLGRETYALTEAEKALSEIRRFDGVRVESARLRGMAARGWPLGSPQDGGGISWLERPLTFRDGRTGQAVQSFEEGLTIGGGDWEDKVQTLRTLQLYHPWTKPANDAFRFGDLDALSASEMLRGLALLADTAIP